MDGARVYVQVVPIEAGREIGWGSNLVQQLDERRESIKEAIVAGSNAVAESLAQLGYTGFGRFPTGSVQRHPAGFYRHVARRSRHFRESARQQVRQNLVFEPFPLLCADPTLLFFGDLLQTCR